MFQSEQQSLLFNLEHALLVHLVNFLLVGFLGLVSLDLHRVGDDSPHLEVGLLHIDVLCLLEALKSRLLAQLVEVVHNLCPHLDTPTDLLVAPLNTLAFG